MPDGPITWDNIEGLTDEERALFKMVIQVDDLRTNTIERTTVNGVVLPTIRNGVVER